MRTSIAALAAFAKNLGLAFQIIDDLLDVEGDPAETGKGGPRGREEDDVRVVQRRGGRAAARDGAVPDSRSGAGAVRAARGSPARAVGVRGGAGTSDVTAPGQDRDRDGSPTEARHRRAAPAAALARLSRRRRRPVRAGAGPAGRAGTVWHRAAGQPAHRRARAAPARTRGGGRASAARMPGLVTGARDAIVLAVYMVVAVRRRRSRPRIRRRPRRRAGCAARRARRCRRARRLSVGSRRASSRSSASSI